MTTSIGIIGSGGIAALHADAFSKVGARIAAVCDVDREKAQRLAGQHQGAAVTTSVHELLEIDDLSAVVVAVPNDQHMPMALAALAAGRDVLLEKPMALNVGECDAIVDAWQASGRILQMGFVCRGGAASLAAKELVDAGRLGEVYYARANLMRRRGIPGLGRWFTTKSQSGGGVLIDLGVHMIDLVMHMIGERRVATVTGTCANAFRSPLKGYRYSEMWSGPPNLEGVFDVEDFAAGQIRFQSGLVMDLNLSWAGHLPKGAYADGVLLLGDRGGLHFDPFADHLTLAEDANGYCSDTTVDVPAPDPWGAAFRRQAGIFLDAVATGTPAPATGEHGRDVQRVLDAFYESASSGREVALT